MSHPTAPAGSFLCQRQLLCPEESTDDDRVVLWHWEEVRGPLREEKVSADTAVLTLTSLVPGSYTFRYRCAGTPRLSVGEGVCANLIRVSSSLTVTDSDGATNSTLATLSVNKAKDYRPVANAGPNQVCFLPPWVPVQGPGLGEASKPSIRTLEVKATIREGRKTPGGAWTSTQQLA